MRSKLKDRVITLEERSINDRRRLNDAVEQVTDNEEVTDAASSEAINAKQLADAACGGVFSLAGKLKNHGHPKYACQGEVSLLRLQLTALDKKSSEHGHGAYEGAHTRINDLQKRLATYDEKFTDHGETLYRHKRGIGKLFQQVDTIEKRMVIQQVEQETITDILTKYKDMIAIHEERISKLENNDD